MYNAIKEGKENFLGVVLLYDSDIDSNLKKIEIIEKCTSVKKVCIGGIGAGNYASTMLYPFLKKNSNIEFVSLATATGINAKDKAVKNNFRYATTDYKIILADDEINTVVIATRHNQHAKMVAEALKENKNVYVEKPLAINEEEIINIIEAYKSSNRLLMVGYNRRYSSSIKYLKKCLNPNVPYSIYYQVNAGFVDKNNWYQSPEQGGRIIGECGHFVDTLQYLLDANPISVFTNSSATGDMPEQDNSFITIRFDNGSTCVIAYLSDGDNKYPKEKIFITGFRTNIEFDNFKKIRIFQNGKTKIKKYSSLDKGQKDEMNSLVNAVIKGKQPVSFESTILTTLTTIYAIESLKNQKRIPISLNGYF
jgi:predicted dehydrogenase